MIATLLKASWLNLKRDYVALALTFVLPVVFFSIFALIFGNMGGSSAMSNVDVVVVDEDDSEISRRLVEAIDADPALDLQPAPGAETGARYDREQARELVRDGDVRVAIIIPPGFGESFFTFSGSTAVELLADTVADPVAHQMVGGLLQRAAMTAAPDLLAERGLDQFDKYVGLTDEQRTEVKPWLEALGDLNATDGETGDDEAAETLETFSGVIEVETSDVRAPDEADKKADTRRRIVAYYAAAIGVMFLLFSMAGAMSAMLEEQRTGTLERLLNSNLSMGTLLISYWLFAALMGFVQLTVMFVWGWAVFGLDLWTANHLAGFAVMTAVTAAAASGFGILLGTVCRSEGQLRGISTIVILVMSAVGGSMVPRFVMSDAMQKAGLATFNGWALDGYRKVFHIDAPIYELWPQVLALAGMAAVFLIVARLSARRWESV
ncbi:MAG: ABC transporter permease [Planctomycetota bacterium]|jgi:ABC-2 type transport system permease protein